MHNIHVPMHMTHAGAARVAAATGRGHATRLRARHRAGRLPAAAGAAGRPLKAVKAESRAQAAPVLLHGGIALCKHRSAARSTPFILGPGPWSCVYWDSIILELFFCPLFICFSLLARNCMPPQGPGFPNRCAKVKKKPHITLGSVGGDARYDEPVRRGAAQWRAATCRD